jgi:hypothetical protein
VAVIALHNCGKSHSKIFELLKHMKSLWMIVYWANKRYKELWRVEDRARPGRPRSVRNEAAIKTVWERIHRNPIPKQKITSQEMNILTQSMLHFIRDSLHMRDYQWSKGHLLTPTVKERPMLDRGEFRPQLPGL